MNFSYFLFFYVHISKYNKKHITGYFLFYSLILKIRILLNFEYFFICIVLPLITENVSVGQGIFKAIDINVLNVDPLARNRLDIIDVMVKGLNTVTGRCMLVYK
jgi:hypothetical protein